MTDRLPSAFLRFSAGVNVLENLVIEFLLVIQMNEDCNFCIFLELHSLNCYIKFQYYSWMLLIRRETL